MRFQHGQPLRQEGKAAHPTDFLIDSGVEIAAHRFAMLAMTEGRRGGAVPLGINARGVFILDSGSSPE
jgi:hypothetical protein